MEGIEVEKMEKIPSLGGGGGTNEFPKTKAMYHKSFFINFFKKKLRSSVVFFGVTDDTPVLDFR